MIGEGHTAMRVRQWKTIQLVHHACILHFPQLTDVAPYLFKIDSAKTLMMD